MNAPIQTGKAPLGKSAFLLNANARAVSARLESKMRRVVPAGDLYFSKSFDDAERTVGQILDRGYGRVFVGGGDGTLVHTANLLRDQAGETAPAMGILKLGTGNAVAGLVGARHPIHDAAYAAEHGHGQLRNIDWVQCEDGTLTPFAGMGWDGDVLNDYNWLKNRASTPLSKKAVESVWGYLGAMLFRTVPRFTREGKTEVVVRSNHDAYRVMRDEQTGEDIEVRIPAGEIIYQGLSPVVSVGSVPCYGFGFTMFPFAMRKAGYMQVRVGDLKLPKVLSNLYPKIWNGSYRHPDMHDVLVKDVIIEGARPMNYQVGGDAAGTAERLYFQVADRPPSLFELNRDR
jgi:diacylglycerol kinase family enzyme